MTHREFIQRKCMQIFPTLSEKAQKNITEFASLMVDRLLETQLQMVERIVQSEPHLHWHHYQCQVVQYMNLYGREKAVALTGLGQSTLYRWRRELEALSARQIKEGISILSSEPQKAGVQGSERQGVS